jgi:hypothetical protein
METVSEEFYLHLAEVTGKFIALTSLACRLKVKKRVKLSLC